MSWLPVSSDNDLENGRPGKLGKQTPRETNSEQSHNVRNEARGAQIVNNGISGWLVVLCVLLAATPGFAALVAVMMFGVQVSASIGTVSATATNAKDIATLSERNAKLAQYQLEEAAKKYSLEIPRTLPQESAK